MKIMISKLEKMVRLNVMLLIHFSKIMSMHLTCSEFVYTLFTKFWNRLYPIYFLGRVPSPEWVILPICDTNIVHEYRDFSILLATVLYLAIVLSI